MVLLRIALGFLLIAHGAVHLLYLVPDVEVFSLDRSWLVPEGARRTAALVLMAAVIAAFALVGLAVWGVPGLSTGWPALTIVASALSLVLLIAYWNTQLLIGVAIDVALIAAAVTRPEWVERVVGG